MILHVFSDTSETAVFKSNNTCAGNFPTFYSITTPAIESADETYRDREREQGI